MRRFCAESDVCCRIEENSNSNLKEVSLTDCLKQFQTPEVLTEQNEWYCNKCQEHQKATKEWKIYKAPPILVFHLKRFKNIHSKIHKKVTFPTENLDLSEYIVNPELPMDYDLVDRDSVQFLDSIKKKLKSESNGFNNEDPVQFQDGALVDGEMNGESMPIETDTNQKEPLLYDLFAVSNHLGGSAGGGHYTAYCKNFKNEKWYHFNDQSVTEVNQDKVCTDDAYVLFYRRKGQFMF